MINQEKIILYPTDTVYGLGCSIWDYNSVNKIYTIKGKSFHENLSFVVSDINEIAQYADVSNKQFSKIKDLLKKGSHYTFVLKKRKDISLNLSKDDEIGLRVLPKLKVLTDLFGPIVTTSANIHGERAPKCIEEISESIRTASDIIINKKGGCYYGKASIVYDLINDKIKRY